MEDNITLQNCSENDVFSFQEETHKVNSFKKKIITVLTRQVSNQFVACLVNTGVKKAEIKHSDDLKYANGEWFHNGKECEILKLGSTGWQKGKVRLKVILEFCPDEPELSEPESPLDSLRQQLIESQTPDN
ncbi:KGK domain protein [Lyngbya aestuarii BL J]|uniref:KGK domain protein n=1 Tax=Lyngbya aestuarii BL J TaxID=1348334 RepID=U7QH94_9CYAN|nr:KGK domain-containing protein [Lyngbya aestuarii]ERT06415.1 KGK domain protein [Lyngbya aestuarii BL J]